MEGMRRVVLMHEAESAVIFSQPQKHHLMIAQACTLATYVCCKLVIEVVNTRPYGREKRTANRSWWRTGCPTLGVADVVAVEE